MSGELLYFHIDTMLLASVFYEYLGTFLEYLLNDEIRQYVQLEGQLRMRQANQMI